MEFLSYALIWLFVCACISVGIAVTGKWALLFFLLVPLCISVKSKTEDKDEQD